jgi:Tfp pilus assembly protein PilF
MADRYTYVPLIGLFIIMAWGVAEIVGRWRLKPAWVALAVGILLLSLMAASRVQVGHWANSLTLYAHALKVTENNATAHINMGKALNDAGRSADAYQHYSEALRIKPHSAHAHVNWGSALLANGKTGEAIEHFNQALRLKPDFAEAYNNLGLAHVRNGKIEQAVSFFRMAVEKNPHHANAALNLNLAEAINEKIISAAKGLREIIFLNASDSDLILEMAELTHRKRALVEAVNDYRKALALQPGISRLEAGDITAVSDAMQAYERLRPVLEDVVQAQPDSGDANYHLACIYARKGMIRESNVRLQKAIMADPAQRRLFETDPDLETTLNAFR